MDEHLAGCPTCHETFAETLRFALDQEAEEVLPRSSLVAIPFVRRPAFRLAAVLAVAASVFLAFQQLWRARSGRPTPPMVAELAQAMGTTRFVEPRLTGGFQHGRLIVLRSSVPQGLDAQSPAVLAAVARIRERTEGDTSPEALGALAVTYLVSGDITKAVSSSRRRPGPEEPWLLRDRCRVLCAPAASTSLLTSEGLKRGEVDRARRRSAGMVQPRPALEQLHLADPRKPEDFRIHSTSG
jgi:hypothetical protein